MNHLPDIAIMPYMHGAATALCLVVTLFFARLWRRARERFYLFFAIAFALMAAGWAILGSGTAGEHAFWPYLTRLVAFLFILAAIIDKNRRAARS